MKKLNDRRFYGQENIFIEFIAYGGRIFATIIGLRLSMENILGLSK